MSTATLHFVSLGRALVALEPLLQAADSLPRQAPGRQSVERFVGGLVALESVALAHRRRGDRAGAEKMAEEALALLDRDLRQLECEVATDVELFGQFVPTGYLLEDDI
jgi:hypothetical protein